MPGLVDLAVNVRSGGTPGWLAEHIRSTDLAAYPDQREAVAAVAARHGRAVDEALLTAGAAEAFVLLARALRPRRAVVVHPQFTEPEAALRAAGHLGRLGDPPVPVHPRPGAGTDDADLVFVGNPTNPTSVAHPRAAVLGLVRPGRIVVVDEAFADCLPGERETLAGHGDLTGLVVIRSLTKTWGLAGLRVGYVLAAPGTVRLLAAAQPLWAVSTPTLAACVATASPRRCARRGSGRSSLAAERARTCCAAAWTVSRRAPGSCRMRRRRSCCLIRKSRTCAPGCSAGGSRSGAARRSPGSAPAGSGSPSGTPRFPIGSRQRLPSPLVTN